SGSLALLGMTARLLSSRAEKQVRRAARDDSSPFVISRRSRETCFFAALLQSRFRKNREERFMALSMFQSSIPVFIKTLTSLKAILDKGAAHAQAKKIDETVLLQSRLYPDMLPFTSQVQIAADQARAGADRIIGSEPATWEDNEKTFAELVARL